MLYMFYWYACDISSAGILCVPSVTDSGSGTAVLPLLYSLAAGENHRRFPFQSKYIFGRTDFTEETQLA